MEEAFGIAGEERIAPDKQEPLSVRRLIGSASVVRTAGITVLFLPPAIVGISGLAFGAEVVPTLTRDVGAIPGKFPFKGFLSSLGAFLLFLASAVPLLTVRLRWAKISENTARFLAAMAILSALLWIDDYFMMHERVLHQTFRIREELTLAAGGVIVLAYFRYFWREIWSHHPKLMLVTMACLCGSVMLDVIEEPMKLVMGDWQYFFEETLKWFGIVGWCYWNASYCDRVIADRGVGYPQDWERSG